MGLQARLMSQALRKLTATVAKTNTTVIFINQIRMKIGIMFGNPETTPGGKALKFYSSVRIEIRRRANIKKGDKEVGMRAKIKVVKNKVSPPFQNTEVDLMYGFGISREGDLVDCGVQYGVLRKSGSWVSYEGQKIGQGREAVKKFLKENPKISTAIETQIWKKVREGVTSATVE
jgi:recombination protein RecA